MSVSKMNGFAIQTKLPTVVIHKLTRKNLLNLPKPYDLHKKSSVLANINII